MAGNAGKGRVKGSKNKTTTAVKEALTAVYAKKGGDAALLTWAKENETEFYKLWGRMLPMEHTGEGGGPIQTSMTVAFVGVRRNEAG